MTKLNKRAADALEILRKGGYFRNALERNSYTGREQFQTRLYSPDGYVIKGYGFKTHADLEKAGWLQMRKCLTTSAWPTEWEARETQLLPA